MSLGDEEGEGSEDQRSNDELWIERTMTAGSSDHAGSRLGLTSIKHEKERVIAFQSPSKRSDRKMPFHFSPTQKPSLSPLQKDEDAQHPSKDPPSGKRGSIQGIYPQMVMNKLKPVKDDFMNYFNGAQGSISQLSFNVNDAAGGKLFADCYDKREILGEGGFAFVYRCYHYERQHHYAVKVILEDSYECDGENLKEEVDALKRLRDVPYIVRLLDVFYEPGVCYMVMEEMKGGDLLDRLCHLEVYEEEEGRKICRKLLEAIYYCHKKRIVHRDIKPENILLNTKENNTSIKLADFGCSRVFEIGKKTLHTLCGSPQYVAPELYMNDNGYDERCDLWSAAVVMYIILGGYAPFDAPDHKLPAIICDGYFEFHDKYWSEISDEPKDVIRGLLEVDPEDRITLIEALDSEWLKRRDKEKLRSSKQLDESLTSFEAWCRTQNSDPNTSRHSCVSDKVIEHSEQSEEEAEDIYDDIDGYVEADLGEESEHSLQPDDLGL